MVKTVRMPNTGSDAVAYDREPIWDSLEYMPEPRPRRRRERNNRRRQPLSSPLATVSAPPPVAVLSLGSSLL